MPLMVIIHGQDWFSSPPSGVCGTGVVIRYIYNP
jgi:hypothetical protein